MEQPTVNSIMLKLSTEILDDPNELSQYLVYLTANLYKYGRDTVEAEIAYAKRWQEVRLTCETDGQANINVKSEPEYQKWQMAKVSEKAVLEVLRAIKKRLSSLSNEFNSY